MIDAYLCDLARCVRVRGRARRRLLDEARDHLADLAQSVGEVEAIRRFGAPAVVAAEFDLACSTRRGIRAGWSAGLGIVATGASTLALLHSADPGVRSPVAWAVVFFLTAQLAAVCAALVSVQALRMRSESRGPADVALLDRRAFVGLGAGALTMFAAGAAQPGQGSPLLLLGGPLIGLCAGLMLLRSWQVNRHLEGAHHRLDSPPLADIAWLTGLRISAVGPVAVAAVAAGAAFVRDLGEHGSTPLGSLVVAAVEAGMVLGTYAAMRRHLGLKAA